MRGSSIEAATVSVSIEGGFANEAKIGFSDY